jgi:hypothetical protein
MEKNAQVKTMMLWCQHCARHVMAWPNQQMCLECKVENSLLEQEDERKDGNKFVERSRVFTGSANAP